MDASPYVSTQQLQVLARALELLGLHGAAALATRSNEHTSRTVMSRRNRARVTLNAHGMRVDARTADRTAWLDVVPEDADSALPHVAVFLDLTNVITLRRQLDDVAEALGAVQGDVELAPREALATSGAVPADPGSRASDI